jgi:hypothetical protein
MLSLKTFDFVSFEAENEEYTDKDDEIQGSTEVFITIFVEMKYNHVQ